MMYEHNNVSINLRISRGSLVLRLINCLFLHVCDVLRSVEEMDKLEGSWSCNVSENRRRSALSCKAPKLLTRLG